MKLHFAAAVLALSVFVPFSSCSSRPDPVLDHATVVARNASVRQRNSSTSRTVLTLNPGDEVQVLERQDNWYRVRHGERNIGWMEESTIVTDETKARIQKLAAASQSQRP